MAKRLSPIADHRGRPIEVDVLDDEISAPTTTGVRSILSTHPATGLTPEGLAAILRESEAPGAAERYLELAEDMEERHLHYLGVLQTRRRAVAQIGVEVIPASDAGEDARIADLVREFFARPALEGELYDMLDAIGKGFSVSEIVWDHSERQWLPSRVVHRLPQWFDFDEATGAQLVRRSDDGAAWTPLEPAKFVAPVMSAKSGLPIRGGLARAAAWNWMFGNFTLKDWVRYAEAYGQPLRVGKYHAGATDREIAILRRAVRDLGADCAAVIPEEMLIEFVTDSQGGAARSEVFSGLARHLDDQLSVVVLGQTLTTQPGDSGSYSLGQVHDRVRRDIERSDGRQLAAALRRDLVRPIVDLNFGPGRAYPGLRIERADPVDIERVSLALERLVPLGVDVPTDHVRAMLGMPKPAEGDDVLSAPGPGVGVGRADPTAAAARDRDAIEAAAELAAQGWQPLMDPVADPILAAARDAQGMEALRAELPRLLAKMDPDALAAALARLMFSANLSGRADG